MKVAICCIAKNQDNYIDEWIDYHFKLGVDNIHIYQNNWKYNGKFLYDERIVLEYFQKNPIVEGGQILKYNEFIQKYCDVYDWAAFIDIDEFISLRQDDNIKSFLSKYEQYKSLGLHWNMFGTNNVKFDGKNYSYINRFLYCAKKLNHHIKVIIHLSLTKKEACFCDNVHNIDKLNWTISANKKHFINGYCNEEQLYDKSIAVINHYYFKTKQQFMIKCQRNGCSFDFFDKMEHQPNLSEEEDLNAFNFYNE